MKNWINSLISIVAIVISFVAIGKEAPAQGLDFDYIGAIVGVLSFLVTVLIGYQIYTVINVKEELKEVSNLKDDIAKKLDEKGDELTKEYKKELQNSVPIILTIASADTEAIVREVFRTYKETQQGQLAKDMAEQSILTILAGFSRIKDEKKRKEKIEQLSQNVTYDEIIEFYTDFAKSDNSNLPKEMEPFILELIGEIVEKEKDGNKK